MGREIQAELHHDTVILDQRIGSQDPTDRESSQFHKEMLLRAGLDPRHIALDAI